MTDYLQTGRGWVNLLDRENGQRGRIIVYPEYVYVSGGDGQTYTFPRERIENISWTEVDDR
jgi:hypothetical protein